MPELSHHYHIIITFTFALLLTLDVSSNTLINKNKKNYQRIIALSPHSVEMLYAIGAGDRIIATVDYADYPPAAKKIPRIGSYTGIDIEKILLMQPDLIVAWKKGNKQDDLLRLESLGFKLFYTQPNTIEQVISEINRLAHLIDLDKPAKIISKQLIQRYTQIKNDYANKTKVKVFYQLWKDPLRTVGENSWIDSLIRDCNGTNIFHSSKSAYPIVSLETILIKNPQVIIIPNHSGQNNVNTKNWQKWNMIDAIKNNHIYTLDGDLLHRVGPRALDGLEKLCQKIDSVRAKVEVKL